ncbi:DNA-binding helix-turn-helix protein [Candidatus Desulfosporosinus infrequens]|uniref:DNA-binding helix-turn-helix protein n=1 Tax=Candidatus Desulfosporosinus infrequens TaxID=2043169 RepID=A0A2U3KDD0_9FIRM|nr:DNA-binding helix-turn-helix protein [Candidatus Desulfosporosinus infrequens]
MCNERNNLQLGVMLKVLLKEHSLSMRKLSTQTGIDIATISRIISGKQLARPKHLQQFAEFFGVPAERFFEAAGYIFGQQKEEFDSDIHASVETIQGILSSANLLDMQYTKDKVEQKLANYEHYAQTEEGQRIIREDYQKKIQQVGGLGPFIDDLNQMYELYCLSSTTTHDRALLGSALLYFILPTDVIPDYIFPIGYLDDAIAVKLVLHKLSLLKSCPEQKDDRS